MTDFFQSILDNIKINIPKQFNDLQFDIQTSSDNKRCSITVAVADEFCADPILTIRAQKDENPVFCQLFAHKWKGDFAEHVLSEFGNRLFILNDFLPNNHFSKCVSNIRFENKISTWIENSVKTAFSNVSP